MKRKLLIAALIAVVVAAAGVVAAPTAAQYFAERQIDKALSQIRHQSTSTADRGPVSVDIRSRTVTVRDLLIVAPGEASKVRIESLTIRDPYKRNKRLTADLVVFENVEVSAANETIKIPRIEIRDYAGPARGLVTTPGIGRAARSQAEVIAQVSVSGASIPSIEMTGDKSGLRRSISDVAVGAVRNGVIDVADVRSVTIDARRRPGDRGTPDEAPSLKAGPISYRSLNLPTLWSFYAGDGAGERQPLAGSITVQNLATSFSANGARISISAAKLDGAGLRLRSLETPFSAFDWIASPPDPTDATPADVRRQLLFASDLAHAFSFDKIAVTAGDVEVLRPGENPSVTRFASLGVGPYSDARMDSVAIEGLRHSDASGSTASATKVTASGFDAAGLAAYVEKVGRDKAMMTSAPSVDDVVRISPRVSGLSASDIALKGRLGEATVGKADIAVDAPTDNVPQHVAVDVASLEIAPTAGNWAADALRSASLERLRGSAKFALTLNPGTQKLSLDELDYRFDRLGAIRARGGLAEVDPAIAMFSGLKLFDKVSAIVLEPFMVSLRDDGVVAHAIAQAADKADVPPELYREALAERVQTEFAQVMGPTGVRSSEALADFVRNPRALDVTISPKSADVKLVDFIRSLALGPAGVAQTIDVAVLNRR